MLHPEVFLDVIPRPGLAQDAHTLYFLSWDPELPSPALGGRLSSIPLDGGRPRELVTGLALPQRLIARRGELFVLDLGRLFRLRLEDLAVTELAAGQGQVEGLDASDELLYWSCRDGGRRVIRRVPKDGGTSETVVEGDVEPRGLAIAGGTLFWIDGYAEAIMASRFDGREATVVHQASVQGLIVADEEILFWAEDLESATSYIAAVRCDGGPVRVIARDLAPVVSLAADSHAVYFATSPYVESSARGSKRVGSSVAMVERSGGTPNVIATDNRTLGQLLRVNDWLYWMARVQNTSDVNEPDSSAILRVRLH